MRIVASYSLRSTVRRDEMSSSREAKSVYNPVIQKFGKASFVLPDGTMFSPADVVEIVASYIENKDNARGVWEKLFTLACSVTTDPNAFMTGYLIRAIMDGKGGQLRVDLADLTDSTVHDYMTDNMREHARMIREEGTASIKESEEILKELDEIEKEKKT